MRIVIKIALALFVCVSAYAQRIVEYSSDFVFKEGLYITFEDFKNNNPVPITHILSDYDIRDEDYLEQVLGEDSIIYFDNLYEERQLSVVKIWGFCVKNRVYIGFGASSSFDNPEFFDFYPLLNVGRLSFFTAYEQYYRTISTGPNVGMGVGFYDPMFNNDMTVTETGQVQLMLDYDSGKTLLVARGELGFAPPELVLHVLQRDPVLLEEYRLLNPRDQKQKSMFFLRRFNERNPIYFPE